MKNYALLAACSLLFSQALFAQPQPCGPNPDMKPFCSEACIICDINGFTGINSDGVQGQAPPGFCTNNVHHMQWIGFIAGSTNLTLSVSVFNCQNGNGLEVGIYYSLDCQTFQLVSNCDTDIPPNTTQTFTNTVPLTIGQYYFFVMDGNQNDVCSYTIKVVSGTTLVPPLANSGTILGPDTICTNTPTDYQVSLPPGAARFSWTLNGQPFASETDTTVTLEALTPGINQLCVTASNTCDTAAPACRSIYVHGIAPTDISAAICPGDCFAYGDTLLCDAGNYAFHYPGSLGCDSLVRVSVQALQAASTNLNVNLCDGDSITVGGNSYSQTGQYQENLLSVNGCDSIVHLALQIIQCNLQGQITAKPASCHGLTNGALEFSVANGTPPFGYFWERIGGTGPSGAGAIAALITPVSIPNLPAGTYSVAVQDLFGNQLILLQTVIEPPLLAFSTTTSNFNGFNIGCAGDANGSIAATVTGGLPPYTFAWSTGNAGPDIQNLPAGTYRCTVTDAAGCSKVQGVVLSEPPPLLLDAQFQDPGCTGINTGEAHVIQVTGGVAPYQFALSGGGFGADMHFLNLPPGSHTLTAKDANGCTDSASAVFKKPIIPNIELGPDLTVELAESIQLQLVQDTPLDLYAWAPPLGLSCIDCPEPLATPAETSTYTLTVEAPGGCTATDSLTITVLKTRDVYIPNVFSPNDDGANDYFTVYGGPEVLEVKLEVYSRWGELLFRNIGAANDDQRGWDGWYRGDPVSPGVFVWRADILFYDGVRLSYSGNVTVVR